MSMCEVPSLSRHAAKHARLPEEDALFREYARNRAVPLRNQLVLRYERFARRLADRFAPVGPVGSEDLAQVALLGLATAVERYDPSTGIRFTSFAVPTIVGVIKHYLRDQAWCLKTPRRLRELAARLRRLRDTLTQRLGRVPSIAEVAEAAGVTEEQALQAMETEAALAAFSLDTLHEDEEECDMHQAIGAHDPQLVSLVDREWVRGALGRLDEREQAIVVQRYFYEASQREIATRLGISQMHVSRLERRALDRLRTLLE